MESILCVLFTELPSVTSTEHKTRALSAADDENESQKENPIKQVTEQLNERNETDGTQKSKLMEEKEKRVHIEETEKNEKFGLVTNDKMVIS